MINNKNFLLIIFLTVVISKRQPKTAKLWDFKQITSQSYTESGYTTDSKQRTVRHRSLRNAHFMVHIFIITARMFSSEVAEAPNKERPKSMARWDLREGVRKGATVKTNRLHFGCNQSRDGWLWLGGAMQKADRKKTEAQVSLVNKDITRFWRRNRGENTRRGKWEVIQWALIVWRFFFLSPNWSCSHSSQKLKARCATAENRVHAD